MGDADPADRAAGPGDLDGEREALVRPHRLEHGRRAAALRSRTCSTASGAAESTGVRGTEPAGDLEASVVVAHRHDPLRSEPSRGEHSAEAHGAVADDDCGRARPDAGADGCAVARRHHVGEQERASSASPRRPRPPRRGRRASRPPAARARPHPGHRPPRAPRRRRAGTTNVGPRGRTRRSRPSTRRAPRRGRRAGSRAPPARPPRRSRGTRARRGSPACRSATGPEPEIRAADPCARDADDGVGGLPERGVGNLLDADVSRPVVDRRPHSAADLTAPSANVRLCVPSRLTPTVAGGTIVRHWIET